MHGRSISTLAALGALWAFGSCASAAAITDPVGDFLPTYVASGRPTGADLDVVSAEVIYHASSHQFEFIGTMAGAIGTTPPNGGESALYVWGLDRGQGTERFLGGVPSIGDGVAFDAVVILRPNGTITLNLFGIGGGVTNLATGALVSGNTISAFLSESLLPSAGDAFADYTWNLWPRFGAGLNAQISDFAPNEAAGAVDAANARVTVVPEPSSLALLGIGALALAGRRKKRGG